MNLPLESLSPDDPAFDPVADLVSVLDLVPADQVDPGAVGAAGHPVTNSLGERDEVFYGRSQPFHSGRVFGGQVVAQSLVAAARSVASDCGPERTVHSLHGYFLRGGDAAEPIQFAVQRLYDGGSFSMRRVHAIQYGKAILSMIFSFQTPVEGFEHAVAMPDVPAPETLQSAFDEVQGRDDPASRLRAKRPVDIRHVEGSLYGEPRERLSTEHVWMRTVGPLPDDPILHAAVLAYASDSTILEVAVRAHGLTWSDPRLRAASLDHSMWFHRPARADEWILFAGLSPAIQNGRGLGQGHMFTRDGALVTTVAQEGMLRLKQ